MGVSQLVKAVIAVISSITAFGSSTQDISVPGNEAQTGNQLSINRQILPEQFSSAFLAGQYEAIYKQTSKDFQKEVPYKQFKTLAEDVAKEVKQFILQSRLPLTGAVRYVWVDDRNSMGLTVTFDETNTILGMRLILITAYPDTDQKLSKTEFILPFKGEWFAFWGGTNVLVNYHYEYESQRYAYDFIMMKEDKSFGGDEAVNESYYAFGAEVVAPASGRVVSVVNDIKDNEPVGAMNASQPAGNYVVIDHGNQEYSILAHLKYGSIQVKAGDQVEQGDLLGLCGNSGNSSEPHLHFQVSDSPDLFQSKSIRVRFKGYPDVIQGQYVKQ